MDGVGRGEADGGKVQAGGGGGGKVGGKQETFGRRVAESFSSFYRIGEDLMEVYCNCPFVTMAFISPQTVKTGMAASDGLRREVRTISSEAAKAEGPAQC